MVLSGMATVKEEKTVCDSCTEAHPVRKVRIGDEDNLYRIELCQECRRTLNYESLMRLATQIRGKAARATMKVVPMSTVRKAAKGK